MDIYVVRSGDTLSRIAQSAGVPESRIISDNELSDPSRLVPGQTLVIQYPRRVHTNTASLSISCCATIRSSMACPRSIPDRRW